TGSSKWSWLIAPPRIPCDGRARRPSRHAPLHPPDRRSHLLPGINTSDPPTTRACQRDALCLAHTAITPSPRVPACLDLRVSIPSVDDDRPASRPAGSSAVPFRRPDSILRYSRLPHTGGTGRSRYVPIHAAILVGPYPATGRHAHRSYRLQPRPSR